ncbi:MAG: VanZ family protein [Desulfobacterales bacterium]|nr:VanZ family protein [Desulfobacterales bacterium]
MSAPGTGISGWRVLPALMVMAGIFFLSHLPGKELPLPPVFGIDKLLHAGVYAVLAWTIFFALHPHQGGGRPSWRLCLLVVALTVLYGISDEFHQSFVPGRFPSGWDVVADGAGGLLAAWLWLSGDRRQETGDRRQRTDDR